MSALRNRLLHWQSPAKLMVSNGDDQLIVHWYPIAVDCVGHRGPGFQVVFYFLAETSGPKILEDNLPFRGYFDVQVPEYGSQG